MQKKGTNAGQDKARGQQGWKVERYSAPREGRREDDDNGKERSKGKNKDNKKERKSEYFWATSERWGGRRIIQSLMKGDSSGIEIEQVVYCQVLVSSPLPENRWMDELPLTIPLLARFRALLLLLAGLRRLAALAVRSSAGE